ncbi:hypothetical protein [Pseudoalteromonas sp. Of7M-16]|uniref:hypothetical protein n=1 Tax=Pseudoalteromonas sp. Of7M-16 TaxID=2917756 RepID=UPI001EF66DE3|nr:hypothetical protein [Pseudoalteromonas sp. Of7M-16]MCG7547836.1 hypothetical protein [Pseudoalteromonas sp. Of7M-16]
MYTKKHYKMPILASAIASIMLTGCGSSESHEEPKNNNQTIVDQGVTPTAPDKATPQPAPDNQTPEPTPPVVTISGPSDVQEKAAFSLTLSAQDDGEIKSIAWTHDASIDLEKVTDNTGNATFTVPDINQDHVVNFTVTVIDDEDEKVEQVHTVNINRITESLTVQGVVTDSPIQHAKVQLVAGEQHVDVIANEKGEYLATIEVDETEVDEMLKIVALGSDAQPEVEFVSQLGTIGALKAQAGDDGVLNNEENFSVNVTNVTTAEYALLQRTGIDLVSDERLNDALQAVDGESMLTLATLIKVIVDSENYSLPEGVSSTLALVSNEEKASEFEQMVKSSNSAYFSEVKKQILDDKNLTSNAVVSLQGDYLLYQSKYYNTSAYHLSLDENGQGKFVAETAVAVSKLSLIDGLSVMELEEPVTLYTSRRVKRDENGAEVVDEQGNRVYASVVHKSSKLSIDTLRASNGSSIIELNTHTQEFVDGELNQEAQLDTLDIYRLMDKQSIPSLTADEVVGKTWLIQLFDRDFVSQDQTIKRYMFNEDGSVTSNIAGETATWQLQGNALVVSIESGEGAKVLQLWPTNAGSIGVTLVAKETHKVDDENERSVSYGGIMVAKQSDLTVTAEQIAGRWTGFIGRTQALHELRISEKLDVRVGASGSTRYRHGKLENNHFYREYFRDNLFRVCEQVTEGCELTAYMEYEFLAVEGSDYLVYRRMVEQVGTEQEGQTREGIYHYIYTPEYTYKQFSSEMLSDFTRFYVESEMGSSPTIEISREQGFNNDEFISTITRNNASYPVQIVNGLLQYSDGDTEMQVSLLEETDNFISVCVYELEAGCSDDKHQTWYTKPGAVPRQRSHLLDTTQFNSKHYSIEQMINGKVAFRRTSSTEWDMDYALSNGKITLTGAPVTDIPDYFLEVLSKVEIEEQNENVVLTVTTDRYSDGQLSEQTTTEEVLSKVDAKQGLNVSKDEIIGTWSVEKYYEFGNELSTYHFEDGVGYSLSENGNRSEFTWDIDGNVLTLTFDFPWVYRFTLTKKVSDGFQLIHQMGDLHQLSYYATYFNHGAVSKMTKQ